MTTYVEPNFPSKKQLKEAVRSGVKVTVFQAGLGVAPQNGPVTLSGPHYPEPHRWYAQGTMRDGQLVEVR